MTDPSPMLSSPTNRRGARKRTHGLLLVIAVALCAAGTGSASARPAPGFGAAAITKVGTGEILGLAAQSNGHVIAVGFSGKRMLVVQLRSNGAPGRSFNAGQGVATSVVIQPDGKIVVAGTIAPSGSTSLTSDMVVKRFAAGGSIDKSFGTGGTVHARGAVANAVALGPRNTIVAAGSIPGPDGSPRVALIRLRSNGAPDKSFGAKGLSEIDLGPNSQANAVGVQHDGKIVFAGDQSPGLQQVNGLIGRATSSGTLDHSFGHAGLYTYGHPHGGGASSFEALAFDSAGRIVSAGSDVENSGQHALFVRLTQRGAADGGFGSGGILTTPSERNAISGALVGARGLAIGAGGEILAAGDYLDSGETFASVWAVRPNGRLDARVGHGGLLETSFPGALGGEARAIAIAAASTHHSKKHGHPKGSAASTPVIYTAGDILGLSAKNGFVARYSVRGLKL